MVADLNPVSAGSGSASLDRIFGGLYPAEIGAVFHPRLNAVSVEFRHEMVSYRLFMDEVARRQFASALELYNADFDGRSLINRHRQTGAAYGRVSGRLEWQTARFTATSVSHPTIEFGYRFRDNSPFFTVLARSAKTDGDSGQSESRQIRIYFTRAQAAELAAIFDQGFLMGILGPVGDVDATPGAGYDEYGGGPEVPSDG